MSAQRPPPEGPKGSKEESGERALGHEAKATPMGRFRTLAQELLNVSRADIKQAEQEYSVANAARKKKRGFK